MNATDALSRLKRMTQSAIEPTLSDDELNDLLMYAVAIDEDGRTPDNTAWQPTYSVVALNASAAEGWRWKAGKLGAGETFSSDGASFNPEERRRFCMEMATAYAKRVTGTQRATGRVGQSSSAILYDEVLGN